MNDREGHVKVMSTVQPMEQRDLYKEISSNEPSSLLLVSNSQGWGPQIKKTHEPKHAIGFTGVQRALCSDGDKEKHNPSSYVQKGRLKT